ncbi:MAG: hypothetical protein FH749_00265 [Firmicutes bacterium]|nr:hypothetical protein [Bacillota bacterium]
MWFDLLLLALMVVMAIWALTAGGLRFGLVRLLISGTIVIGALPLASGMNQWLRPALAPVYTSAIDEKLVIAVSDTGSEKLAAGLGPWQHRLAMPAASGPEYMEAVLNLTLNTTAYIMLALAGLLFLALAGFKDRSHNPRSLVSALIGLLNGFLLALFVMFCLPVFTLVEQGTVLAEAVSGSAFLNLFFRLLTVFVDTLGNFLL